jgi:serine/threonine-protein kinase
MRLSAASAAAGWAPFTLLKIGNLGDAPRAVKEMIESHLDDTQHEKAIADFKRESLLLTELEHSSIPTVYDYFYDDSSERFYLVMKFIPGRRPGVLELRAAPGGKLDELTITEWGVQVADVLHYLHTRPQPIIYRDLKPANLMFDSNLSRIMLIDFGIARWVNKKRKASRRSARWATRHPSYSVARPIRASTFTVSGATMFHLLTGSDPQDNPLLIFDFTKNPRPRQINPQLTSEIEHMLIRVR